MTTEPQTAAPLSAELATLTIEREAATRARSYVVVEYDEWKALHGESKEDVT